MTGASANSAAARLAAILEIVPSQLAALSDSAVSAKSGEGHWSKKEILGHLIDSAANNHQRFVRAQFAPHLDLPSYEQQRWVAAQQYQSESWGELVNLWVSLNRHLAHVMQRIPADALAHTISLDGREANSLGFVMDDYLGHLEHHLGQIL